ncbi:hypothetical protein ACET3Z_000802 [Daucus carota]
MGIWDVCKPKVGYAKRCFLGHIFSGALENEISLDTYMDWYYNITKLKIVPPSRVTKDPAAYQPSRDKCDVSKAMDLDELMLETFGPTYERPDFKNVLAKKKARRTTESEKAQHQTDFSTSAPFESTQYDVGPSAPHYEVGQSQFRDRYYYRSIIDFGEDPNVPIAREDPIVPIEDFWMEVTIRF